MGGALRKNSLDRSSSFCSKCCKTPQHPPRCSCRCRCSCSCCYSCCCSWEHSYPFAPFVCERGSLQRFSPIARFGLISLFVFLLFYRIFFRNAIPSPSLERFLIAAFPLSVCQHGAHSTTLPESSVCIFVGIAITASAALDSLMAPAGFLYTCSFSGAFRF